MSSGQAIAEAHGASGYPFALIPHPLASASDEELARQVNKILSEVLHLLAAG